MFVLSYIFSPIINKYSPVKRQRGREEERKRGREEERQ